MNPRHAGPPGPRRPVALVLCALVAASCSKDTTAPTPVPLTYHLEMVSGSGQVDTTRATLASPLVVRVVGSDNRPASGVEVAFLPDEVSGKVSADAVTSGSGGLAEVKWTVGSAIGTAHVYASLDWSTENAVAFAASVVAPPPPSTPPLPPATALHATAIATGYEHSCAINDQQLFCWGKNDQGQLGDGTKTSRNVAAALPGLLVSRVAAGGGHTCVVTTDGALYCWGRNVWGQVGDGSTVTRTTPVRISPDLQFSDVVAGAENSCALTTSGTVYCWGFMEGTQSSSYYRPVEVSGETLFASIGASNFGVCGIGADAAAYCLAPTWVADGLSGGGIWLWRPQPAPAPGVRTFSGGLQFTCGVDGAAAAICWGSNGYGQLGVGTTDEQSGPVAVAGGRQYTGVYAGYDWACGITVAGPTYCWGHNSWGVIRDVVNQQYVEPTPQLRTVPNGVTFTTMAGGFYHMCAIGSDTQVYCWGGGFDGQLGDGHSTENYYARSTPALVVRR